MINHILQFRSQVGEQTFLRGSRTESAALSADNSNGLGLNNPGALGTNAKDREDDLVDELYKDHMLD